MNTYMYTDVRESVREMSKYTKFITEESFCKSDMLGRCLDRAGLSFERLSKQAEENEWSSEEYTYRLTDLINKRVKFGPAVYKFMVLGLNDVRSNMVKTIRSEVESKTGTAPGAPIGCGKTAPDDCANICACPSSSFFSGGPGTGWSTGRTIGNFQK